MKRALIMGLVLVVCLLPAYSGISDTLQDAGQNIKEAGANIASAAKEAYETVKPAVSQTVDTMKQKYGPQVSSLYESAGKAMKGAMDKASVVLKSDTMKDIANIASKYGTKVAQQLYETGSKFGQVAADKAVKLYNKYGPEVGAELTKMYNSADASLQRVIDKASLKLSLETMKDIVGNTARLGQAGVENILVAGADFGEAAAKEALQYYKAHGSKKGNEYLKSQEFTNKYRN